MEERKAKAKQNHSLATSTTSPSLNRKNSMKMEITTEHTCMSVIYYDQIKTIVMFDTLLESKIPDTDNILILSNLQKPLTIVCKDVNRTFDLEYSTYHLLNRSELCECCLMAGNYLLSQATSNCGGTPKVKDGFFTTYYAFNWIVLDVLTEKFNIQVDEDTVTQSMLLHSDIAGYDLPATYSKNKMLKYLHT